MSAEVGGTVKWWKRVPTLVTQCRDVVRLSASIRLNILHADIHIYSDLPDWGESGQTGTDRSNELGKVRRWRYTCAVPPTIIALDLSRCKKDATKTAIAAGEATIYYEKVYDSTDVGKTELELIQKSDMPYEIIVGPNSDSPMSVRID